MSSNSIEIFLTSRFKKAPKAKNKHIFLTTLNDWDLEELIHQVLTDSKAKVYNLLGQKVKDFDLKATTTNQTLNKGIYLLEIEKDGTKTSKKLIVN